MNKNTDHELQGLFKSQYGFSVVIRAKLSKDCKPVYCTSDFTDFEISLEMFMYLIMHYAFQIFSNNNKIQMWRWSGYAMKLTYTVIWYRRLLLH